MSLLFIALAIAPIYVFAGPSRDCVEETRPRGHVPAARPTRPVVLSEKEKRQRASRQYNELYRRLYRDSDYRNVDAEAARLRTLGAQAGVAPAAVNMLVRFLHDRGAAAVNSQRASCRGSYDYSSRVGPVRNQDSVGWCYAYTFADYLTFKTGRRISGAGIAVSYNHYWRWIYNLFQPYCGEGKAGWGGNEPMAAFVARRSTLCLESEFPSEDNAGGRIYDNIVALENAKKAGNAQRFEACALEMFPNLKHNDIMDVLRRSNQQNLLKSLSDKACVHRVPMPRMNVDYSNGIVNSSGSLLQKIDRSLTTGNLAAISYSTDILYNIDSSKKQGGHTSLIVGRKWDARKNECVYLVRNSYGPGCRQYDKRLECRNGHLWLPRSVLSKGITDVTIFR